MIKSIASLTHAKINYDPQMFTPILMYADEC